MKDLAVLEGFDFQTYPSIAEMVLAILDKCSKVPHFKGLRVSHARFISLRTPKARLASAAKVSVVTKSFSFTEACHTLSGLPPNPSMRISNISIYHHIAYGRVVAKPTVRKNRTLGVDSFFIRNKRL